MYFMIQFKRRKKNASQTVANVKLNEGQPLIDLETNSLYVGIEDDSVNKVKIGSTIKEDLYTYIPIGEVKYVDSAGFKVASEGDDAADVLYKLFSTKKIIQPTVTQPYITLSLSSSADNEYGTSITSIDYSISTNAGSYTYGPATGVTFSNFAFSGDCESSNSTLTSGTLTLSSKYIVGQSDSKSITCTGTHSEGTIAKDNNGVNSNPEQKISSGTKTASATFGKSAVTYAYYSSTSSTSVPTSRTRGSTSLSSSNGQSISFKKGQYIWIISTKSSGKIQNWVEIAKSWSDTLGGTESPITINSFTQDNGYVRTYYAYRTTNTMANDDTLLIRFQ